MHTYLIRNMVFLIQEDVRYSILRRDTGIACLKTQVLPYRHKGNIYLDGI